MESSEPAAIERLTLANLTDCVALSTEAGWNQIAADWRLFFEQGLVWGIRQGGEVVASAAILPYPPMTAWISMVLTASAARGRGFASHLTAFALDECEKRGLVPQLDATPDGARVYARLGFQKVAEITRWRRDGQNDGPSQVRSASTLKGELESLGALDAKAIGFRRPSLIAWLAERGPSVVAAGAFALSRSGRTAHQIGPVIAPSSTAAETLLSALEEKLAPDCPLIIDANDEAPSLAETLGKRGFQPRRSFTRMAKGTPPRLDSRLYLAPAGPELG